jgi:Asp/Glu/hydantoin racemase
MLSLSKHTLQQAQGEDIQPCLRQSLRTTMATGRISTMADPHHLLKAREIACQEAITQLGAEAIVIGGGPLAHAARAIQSHFTVPIVEPVPEAVRLAISLAKGERLAHLLTES